MKKIAVFCAVFFVMATFNCYAQRLTEGSLDFLKGQERVHVVLNFDNAMLQGKTQEAYLDIVSEEWREGWEEAKSSVFMERLLEHLNKNVNGFQFGNYPDAQYQATVHVLTVRRRAPGQHLEGPGVRNVTSEVVFTKTGDSNSLAKITRINTDSRTSGLSAFTPVGVAGSNTYLTGVAFGYAGQSLGKFIEKRIK